MMGSRRLHFGTIVLIFLPLTRAIISESYDGYLFTAPDQPNYNWMTRDQAQQWCQSNGSALLEIYDSQMQQNVESFVNKTRGQQMFGNINMFTNGERSGDSSWMWVNGKTFNTPGGVLNQPTDDYALGYLLLNQTGQYFVADNSHTTKKGYICERSTLSDCGFSRDGRCYRSSSTTLSWYDARNQCLNGGGDLASFDFVNNQQSLNSLNGSSITANTPYWIGLRRQFWTWERSNLEIKYTHWQDGHPLTTAERTCLCLLSTGDKYEWTECNCNDKNQFICMRNTSEASLPTMSSTRTTVAESGSKASSVVGLSSTTTTTSNNNNKNNTGSSYSGETDKAVPLGVGIGVGVGGALIIIVVIVVVVLLIRRRRQKEPGNCQNQRRLKTPDIIREQQESSYAEIHRTYNSEETETNKTNAKANIVYSDLRITDAA